MTATTIRKIDTPTLIANQALPLAEERVILHNVSWQTFESLLADLGDRRKTLFHYLNGTLEIMSPLSLHEGSNRFIDDLIRAFADELEIDLRKLIFSHHCSDTFGSTTVSGLRSE